MLLLKHKKKLTKKERGSKRKRNLRTKKSSLN